MSKHVESLANTDIINLNKVDAIYNNYLCLGEDLFFYRITRF